MESETYLVVLLICTCAGVLAELITITDPAGVLRVAQSTAEDTSLSTFQRVLLALSLFYMVAIVLMVFSGSNRLGIYAGIIVCMSLAGWLLRPFLAKHLFLLVAESTVSLILLLDTARSIVRSLFFS